MTGQMTLIGFIFEEEIRWPITDNENTWPAQKPNFRTWLAGWKCLDKWYAIPVMLVIVVTSGLKVSETNKITKLFMEHLECQQTCKIVFESEYPVYVWECVNNTTWNQRCFRKIKRNLFINVPDIPNTPQTSITWCNTYDSGAVTAATVSCVFPIDVAVINSPRVIRAVDITEPNWDFAFNGVIMMETNIFCSTGKNKMICFSNKFYIYGMEWSSLEKLFRI